MADIKIGAVTITETQARAVLQKLNLANRNAIDTVTEIQANSALPTSGVSGLTIDLTNIATLRAGLKGEFPEYAKEEFNRTLKNNVPKEISFKPNEREKTFELPVNVDLDVSSCTSTDGVKITDGDISNGKRVVKVAVDQPIPPKNILINLPLTYRGEPVVPITPNSSDRFEFLIKKQSFDTIPATTDEHGIVTVSLPKDVTVEDSEINTYNGNTNNKFKIERDGADKLKFTLKDNTEFDKAESIELNVKVGSASTSEKLKIELKPPTAAADDTPEGNNNSWWNWKTIVGGIGAIGALLFGFLGSKDNDNAMMTWISVACAAVAGVFGALYFKGRGNNTETTQNQ